MAKILTTNSLISTTLRRASIPNEESLFTNQDVIDVINEELTSYIVPYVIRSHESHYVHDEDVAVVSDQDTYKIPYRSVGNKLLDIQFADSNDNLYEMTQIQLGTRMDYGDLYKYRDYLKFYVKGDSVILMDSNAPSSGNFRFSYYLRPNEIVTEDRAGSISAIGNEFIEFTVSSYSDLVAETITINGYTFTGVASGASGKQFNCATSNTVTAASMATFINADSDASALVSASASSGVLTITAIASTTNLSVSYTGAGTVGGTLSNEKRTVTVTSFPDHFSTTTLFDFIQAKSPSKILQFDSTLQTSSILSKTLTFLTSEFPDGLVVGDYIMKAEETIIAQIPTELQPLLCQRAACRLLESLGDQTGLKMANDNLLIMQRDLQTIVDNRVEEAPQKALKRYSNLRDAIGRRFR